MEMSASMSMTKKIEESQGQGLLLSSTLKIEEDTVLTQKQGIVTILGCPSETYNTASASSLRRTLSADMSSKKWLSQNGSPSPMKKIASSEQLKYPETIAHSSSSSEGEDEYEEAKEAEAEAERERLEIWSSIQRNKKEEQEKAGPFDTWESIISLKSNDGTSKSLPVTPYIHPLAKRSKSCLSEKSLEICTESLGSETGSDGLFSSYPPSETGDAEEEEKEEEQQQQQQEGEEKVREEAEEDELLQVPRYNYGAAAAAKKSPPRSFPPPLPSLSRQTGPSLHMRPHRDNGRLVLQAVSLPSQNNFCVQRQDGRLVLTFADHHHQDPKEVAEKEKENGRVEELEEEFGGFGEEEKEDEDEDEYEEDEAEEEEEEVGESESDVRDVESVIEKAPLLSSGITGVHRLAFMVNKPIGLVNRNPNWSDKFNEVANFGDEDVNVVEASHQMAQSLPPRVARLIPSTPASASAAAASLNLNGYEYYWRTTKPAAKAANTLVHHQENNYDSTLKNNSSKIIVSGDMNRVSNGQQQQQLLVLRGKNGDYLVHNWKSCKDSRRSFLFWEPYCIATT